VAMNMMMVVVVVIGDDEEEKDGRCDAVANAAALNDHHHGLLTCSVSRENIPLLSAPSFPTRKAASSITRCTTCEAVGCQALHQAHRRAYKNVFDE
jgi:hypothetical protein